MFFGNSGQTLEDTNESISTALSVSEFKALRQYSPAESPERSVLVVSYPELLTALSDLSPSAGFFSAIRISLISEIFDFPQRNSLPFEPIKTCI